MEAPVCRLSCGRSGRPEALTYPVSGRTKTMTLAGGYVVKVAAPLPCGHELDQPVDAESRTLAPSSRYLTL